MLGDLPFEGVTLEGGKGERRAAEESGVETEGEARLERGPAENLVGQGGEGPALMPEGEGDATHRRGIETIVAGVAGQRQRPRHVRVDKVGKDVLIGGKELGAQAGTERRQLREVAGQVLPGGCARVHRQAGRVGGPVLERAAEIAVGEGHCARPRVRR